MTHNEISNQEQGNTNGLTSSDKLLPAQKDRHNYEKNKMFSELHVKLTNYVADKLRIGELSYNDWLPKRIAIENEIAEILNKYL